MLFLYLKAYIYVYEFIQVLAASSLGQFDETSAILTVSIALQRDPH